MPGFQLQTWDRAIFFRHDPQAGLGCWKHIPSSSRRFEQPSLCWGKVWLLPCLSAFCKALPGVGARAVQQVVSNRSAVHRENLCGTVVGRGHTLYRGDLLLVKHLWLSVGICRCLLPSEPRDICSASFSNRTKASWQTKGLWNIRRTKIWSGAHLFWNQ